LRDTRAQQELAEKKLFGEKCSVAKSILPIFKIDVYIIGLF
jgi:hypothetical protein